MNQSGPLPREVVTLATSVPRGAKSSKSVLVKTHQVEIVQLMIPAGETIPRYEAQGELILHCLSGQISVRAGGECHDLQAQQLLYLRLGDPFSIHATKSASVLVSIIAAKTGRGVTLIGE